MSQILSEFHKQIITAIDLGKVRTYKEFIEKLVQNEEAVWEKEPLAFEVSGKAYAVNTGEVYLMINEERSGLYSAIRDFAFVVEYLKIEGLLEWDPFPNTSDFYLFWKNRDESDIIPCFPAYYLMGKDSKNWINPLPRLKSFIARDFKTVDEYRFHQEEMRDKREDARDQRAKEAEEAAKGTNYTIKAVAVASLGVSAASLLFSALSFMSYSEHRTVKIENARSFRDTVAVRMLNPVVRIDTVVVHDTIVKPDLKKSKIAGVAK